jgi:predicted PurR-regulated permease PerM
MTFSGKKWLVYAGIALLLYLAWVFRTTLIYVLVSLVITLLGAPLVDRLERFRIGKLKTPRAGAALLVLILFLAMASGMLFLVVPVISEQVSTISKMEPGQIERTFAKPLAEMRQLASELGLDPSMLNPEHIKEKLVSLFSLSNVGKTLQGVFGFLGALTGALFSISFITFFFLRDRFLFYRLVHLFTPVKYEPAMQRILRSVNSMLSRYVLALLLQVMSFSTYIFIGLSLIGEQYAFTIALFAGVVNLIPYLGPWIGLGFGLILGISTHLGMDFYQVVVPDMLYMSLVFVIAVLIDNFLTYPLIFSNTLKAHPLELFLVVLMAGTLAGIPGMILGAPVYTVMRIIAREFFTRFDVVRAVTRDLGD